MTSGVLKYKGPPPQALVDQRRRDRMETVDGLPLEWRALVHEYGLTVVTALRCCGVTKANHCRHIVDTILNELSPIRGSFSNQGTLRRPAHLVLVPAEPTEAMIAASMETVSGFDIVVTKREKHRARLRAAIMVASKGV
jgi:hypothetical protein